MTIEELSSVLQMQEEILQFSSFTNADAWELGNLIVAEAAKRGAAVLVRIRLNNGYTVFQYGMDANMFGGANGATLVLNANHPLVKYVAAHKEDDKNVPLICQQLYDLAMMAHKQLSPDEMTQFIARSNQILLALAK